MLNTKNLSVTPQVHAPLLLSGEWKMFDESMGGSSESSIIDLAIGMKGVSSIATDLDITNGARGTIVDIILNV